MENSLIVGDIKFSPLAQNKYEADPKRMETFIFELSELMREYQVVKIDACLDAFAYVKSEMDKT